MQPNGLFTIEKILHSQEYDSAWPENQNHKLIQLQISLANKIGQHFFESAATDLNELVGAHVTFIGTLKREFTGITTISLCIESSLEENIHFNLEGTPCQTLPSSQHFVFENNIFKNYPTEMVTMFGNIDGFAGMTIRDAAQKPIGLMVSYFNRPVTNANFVQTAFELMSSRVQAEMERLLMEEAMRLQQERYQFALNAGDLGVYDWTIFDDTIVFNDRLYEIIGYSPDEYKPTYMAWVELVHPDDYEKLAVTIIRKIKDGREYYAPSQYRILTKNNGYKWVEVESYSYYLDDFKTKKRNIGIVKEIDAQITNEERLRNALTREMTLNQAIKQREEWYAFALKVGRLGVYDWHIKEKRATFSQRLCEMLGWSGNIDTFNFQMWIDAVHPDDQWQFNWKTYREQAEADTHSVHVYRLKNAGGEYRWIEAQNMALEKDERGHIVRMIGIIKDIHDEKRSGDLQRASYENEKRLNETLTRREEELTVIQEKLITQMRLLQTLNRELRESEARWKYALEGNGDGVIEWNMITGNCVFSKRAQEILGLSLDTKEEIGNFMSHIHPVARDEFRSYFQLSIKPPFEPFKMEVQVLDNMNNYRWILFRGKVVEADDEQQPIMMMGTVTDLSDQKMFQKELTIYEEMIKQNQSAILFVAVDGSIEFMNTRAIELLEYREHEILEKHVNQILQKEIPILLEDFRGEITLRTKTGKLLTTQVATSLLRQDGDSLGYVLNIIDVTEKKHLEREITRLTMARLETELESQRKQTEMIIQVQEYEKEALARELHDGVGQLLSLTKLQLEQLSAEALPAHREKHREIQELVRHIVADVKGITSELMPLSMRNLGLESAVTSLLEHYRKIKGDRIAIHQKICLKDQTLDQTTSMHIYRIAQEAINNAMKYSGATTLSVILIKLKNSVNLMVEDDGRGFDLDLQLNKKNSFGLKTMKERAKLLHGKLMINSCVNSGTVVNLSIPVNH